MIIFIPHFIHICQGVSPTSSIITLSKYAKMLNSGNVSTIQSESEMDSEAVQKLKNLFEKLNHYVTILQNYIGLLENEDKADAIVLTRIKQVTKAIAIIKDDSMMILTEDFLAPLANREVQHQPNNQPLMGYRPGSIRPAHYQSQRSLQIQHYIREQPLHKLLKSRNFLREQMLEPLPSQYTIPDLLRNSAQTADNLPSLAGGLSEKIKMAENTLRELQKALSRWILTENQIKKIIELMNDVLHAKQQAIEKFHEGLNLRRNQREK